MSMRIIGMSTLIGSEYVKAVLVVAVKTVR